MWPTEELDTDGVWPGSLRETPLLGIVSRLLGLGEDRTRSPRYLPITVETDEVKGLHHGHKGFK